MKSNARYVDLALFQQDRIWVAAAAVVVCLFVCCLACLLVEEDLTYVFLPNVF